MKINLKYTVLLIAILIALHTISDRISYARPIHDEPAAPSSSWIIKWKKEMSPQFKKTSEIIAEYGRSRIVTARPRAGYDERAWVEQWSRSPDVEYIQANQTYHLSAKPDDPMYSRQTYLRQIHAEKAWDYVTENRSLTIAVVDTGIDLDHPDLKNNLVPGVNLIDRKKQPYDDNGHGTNVAGVIAAVGNNKQGVSGLLWGAKIMPIKALEASGSGDEDKLGEGIRYAVDHGADIVVLSLGLHSYSRYMSDIVKYAENRGVLLIAASGNDGKTVKYPAAYPTVLAVGGATPDNRAHHDSNYGQELDLVAPWEVYTTANGGGYEYKNGTSMAAPQVAAVAALVWAAHPEWKPHELRNHLRQTAEDIGDKGWDSRTGYGLLRADKALTQPYRDDIYENNDKRNAAKPLPINKMISAAVQGADDQDWYVIDAPYDGTIEVQIETDGAAPSDLQLRHVLGSSEKEYSLNKPVNLNVTKGKSYIRISPANARLKQTVKYRLTASFHIYRDAFEDNDRQYKAYVLPARSQKITGTFHQTNDQDWFMINFTQPGTLRLKLSVDTTRIDPAIMIQRTGEEASVVDNASEGIAEYPDPIDVEPGKYYFLISNVITKSPVYPAAGEYTLAIDYATKYVDPNEPNDKPFQAVMMSMNTAYTGVLNTDEDVDWFAFKVKETSYVTIDVSGIPPERLLSFSLLDSSNIPLDLRLNKPGTTRIQSGRKLTAGTYYIRLLADQNFDHQMYKLTVKAQPLIGGFRDIAKHWARPAIVELAKQKIVSGYGDYSFRPENSITRAEAAAMLVKAFGLTQGGSVAFKDVNKSHWAYDAVSKASRAGIVKGYGNQAFAPDRKLNRAEMAAMLAGAMKLGGKNSAEAPFADISDSYWAAPILSRMVDGGYLSGYSDNTFRPEKPASRAEFASILYRAIRK